MDCSSFHSVPFLPYVAIYPTTTLGQSSYNNHYGMTIGILTKLCQNLAGSFWMRFQKMVLKVGIALPTHNNVNHSIISSPHHFITPILQYSTLPSPHHLITHPHLSPSPFTIPLILIHLLTTCFPSAILLSWKSASASLPLQPSPSFFTTLLSPFAKFGYILGVT